MFMYLSMQHMRRVSRLSRDYLTSVNGIHRIHQVTSLMNSRTGETGEQGGYLPPPPPRFLADQLTLFFQPEEADSCHHITTYLPPGFSDLPPGIKSSEWRKVLKPGQASRLFDGPGFASKSDEIWSRQYTLPPNKLKFLIFEFIFQPK